jgi:hypothetical protein
MREMGSIEAGFAACEAERAAFPFVVRAAAHRHACATAAASAPPPADGAQGDAIAGSWPTLSTIRAEIRREASVQGFKSVHRQSSITVRNLDKPELFSLDFGCRY